jgi:phosphatidylglycerophosphate synthase
VVRALLYLPDAGSARLAGARVAGRSLAVRAMVAALRAGATQVAVPVSLRDAEVERALRRMPALAAATRWLTAETPPPAEPSAPWLLLPASSLIHASALESLLTTPTAGAAVLAPSGPGAAPVALAPAALVAAEWLDLRAGRPAGMALARGLAEAGAEPRAAAGPHVTVRDDRDLARARAALEATLGIAADSGVDRYLHRRGSRWISRALVWTPVTPNQVSVVSLAIGLVAVWCFWNATVASAFLGVLLHVLACIVDHADGEIARLTFQESTAGARLDWTIDTAVQAGLVLAIGVTAEGPLMDAVGVLAAAGVILSAVFARRLSRQTEAGASGGLLRTIANRDVFYLVLLSFAVVRWLAPSLVFVVALVVAAGSQGYWVGCLARTRRARVAASLPTS